MDYVREILLKVALSITNQINQIIGFSQSQMTGKPNNLLNVLGARKPKGLH